MPGQFFLSEIQEQAFLYIVVYRLHRNARLELLALLLRISEHRRRAALFIQDRGFDVVCKLVILADFQGWAFVPQVRLVFLLRNVRAVRAHKLPCIAHQPLILPAV